MLLAVLPVIVGGETVESQVEISDAQTLLEAVRSRFPSEPVSISGSITVRRRRGVVVKEMGYELDARWMRTGADIKCVITDALGRASDRVHVSFADGASPEVKREGDGLVAADGSVTDTALNCADLAMPFLWWPNAELSGKASIRGRDSYIVDLKPAKASEHARVRAWIDSSIFIVLQAEIYDGKDNLLKQVDVKSFKKIDDKWMIKDLEISVASAADKTVVTVDDMETATERSEEEGS